ncbi:hypothetical protein [Actinoplanes philippinensis]|uniref:hypothetical protein n=1 Tax=Actinoplanes philippinensis TaxID=35752 RepID=UPI0033D4FAAD
MTRLKVIEQITWIRQELRLSGIAQLIQQPIVIRCSAQYRFRPAAHPTGALLQPFRRRHPGRAVRPMRVRSPHKSSARSTDTAGPSVLWRGDGGDLLRRQQVGLAEPGQDALAVRRLPSRYADSTPGQSPQRCHRQADRRRSTAHAAL